jgi:hypothetical protein
MIIPRSTASGSSSTVFRNRSRPSVSSVSRLPLESMSSRIATAQERAQANCLLAQKMALDDGAGHREEFPCLLVDFLPVLRAAFVDSAPVLQGCRHVSRPAVATLPSPRVDILSPAKQASKQSDSLPGTLTLIRRWRSLDSCGRRGVLRRKHWNRSVVSRQKPPQAGVLRTKMSTLLLGRLKRRKS